MNTSFLILIQLLIVQCLFGVCYSNQFDLFYFILEWPGSRCNRKTGCCYPETGKPGDDFIINGLHPARRYSLQPTFCEPKIPFDQDEFSDLIKDMEENWPPLDCPAKDNILRWSTQWQKYGTCSQYVFNQHQYFEKALDLKNKVNLLHSLKEKGIQPDGEYYRLDKIVSIFEDIANHVPQMFCNKDKYGNHQLHRIRFCLNTSASNFIKCPPSVNMSSCRPSIKFPSF